jgi:glycosyltransferase involved in cell wall biosynthesis
MVAVSNGVLKHMMNYFGIPKRKIEVIPNAIDTERFDLEKVVASRHPAFIRESPNTVILGSVGNISNQKDYGNLIHAVRVFSDKNPETSIKVLIAGESSPLQEELQRTVKELGLSNNTCFLGAIDWVPEFLKSIDIYVQSSRFEGLPCAVLEAMSMQKPVIATSVPGSEELIENEITGLLVPPGDSQKLAGAIEEMISLGSKSLELGVAARKRVIQTYSIKPIVKNIQKLYEAAVRQ